jgi:hypothetical protein
MSAREDHDEAPHPPGIAALSLLRFDAPLEGPDRCADVTDHVPDMDDRGLAPIGSLEDGLIVSRPGRPATCQSPGYDQTMHLLLREVIARDGRRPEVDRDVEAGRGRDARPCIERRANTCSEFHPTDRRLRHPGRFGQVSLSPTRGQSRAPDTETHSRRELGIHGAECGGVL